ncbi:MAG: rhomboid family intramembrane serine protease [Cyanobacteria bacterium P01_H01_bin.15]
MFPISDNNPVRITPYVTYGLIGINIVVFLHQLSLGDSGLYSFFQHYALVPAQLTASLAGETIGQPVPEWLTLFTSQFLHGGWFHIGGNMLFLWIFGNNIEEELGHSRFLGFYLGCGALAALTQWFFTMESTVPSLGASGAIAGVMGAYVLRFPHAQIDTLVFLGFFITTFRVPARFYLGFWFFQQAISSVFSLSMNPNSGGVAYWAHAGGFVFGVMLGQLMGLFAPRRR